MAPVSRQWVLSHGAVEAGDIDQERDFILREESLPELRKEEVLCRALFLSVDPLVRLHLSYGLCEGDVVPGRQVARVVESRNKGFPKGKLVVASLGWQTYSVVNPSKATQVILGQEVPLVTPLPAQVENSGLPKSASLGVMGQNGLMAYLGLVGTCRLKKGETVVLSSAAGATGHLAGQIAKHLGATVIGYTGDPEKASWIKTELGFDWAFNYKTQDVGQTLRIAAPGGVDVFLDSVGGDLHRAVLSRMRAGGRVCVFGNLSYYSDARSAAGREAEAGTAFDLDVALKGLSIHGFNALRFPPVEREEALTEVASLCREGHLRPSEQQVEGFENLPATLADTLHGKFQGKVVVRI